MEDMGFLTMLDGDLTVSLILATLGYAQSLEGAPGTIGKRLDDMNESGQTCTSR